jgi:hypothetical protein
LVLGSAGLTVGQLFVAFLLVAANVHRLINHQLLHNYFSLASMFWLQSFSHHQGEHFCTQLAAHDKSMNVLLVV